MAGELADVNKTAILRNYSSNISLACIGVDKRVRTVRDKDKFKDISDQDPPSLALTKVSQG